MSPLRSLLESRVESTAVFPILSQLPPTLQGDSPAWNFWKRSSKRFQKSVGSPEYLATPNSLQFVPVFEARLLRANVSSTRPCHNDSQIGFKRRWKLPGVSRPFKQCRRPGADSPPIVHATIPPAVARCDHIGFPPRAHFATLAAAFPFPVHRDSKPG